MYRGKLSQRQSKKKLTAPNTLSTEGDFGMKKINAKCTCFFCICEFLLYYYTPYSEVPDEYPPVGLLIVTKLFAEYSANLPCKRGTNATKDKAVTIMESSKNLILTMNKT